MEHETNDEAQLEAKEETQIETTEETQIETTKETQIDTTEERQIETTKETQIETTEETHPETLGQVYRKIEEIPKIFEVKVKNSQAYDSSGNFSSSIQNLLYEKFNEVNYACPLTFTRKMMKKEGYCKSTCFTAKCLFTTCCKYKFVLRNEDENNTTFMVSQIGALKHLKDEIQRRQISRDLRRHYVVNNAHKKYLENLADETKAKQISAGNLTGVPTKGTLRRIKYNNKILSNFKNTEKLSTKQNAFENVQKVTIVSWLHIIIFRYKKISGI